MHRRTDGKMSQSLATARPTPSLSLCLVLCFWFATLVSLVLDNVSEFSIVLRLSSLYGFFARIMEKKKIQLHSLTVTRTLSLPLVRGRRESSDSCIEMGTGHVTVFLFIISQDSSFTSPFLLLFNCQVPRGIIDPVLFKYTR